MGENHAHGGIYLIRHAETVWNAAPKRFQGRIDVGLSDRGYRQIQDYSIRLPLFAKVLTSPAKRCRDTLKDLLKTIARRPPIIEDSRLWEIDNGWFSGKTVPEVEARDPQHLRRWLDAPGSVRPGDGEKISEMAHRVTSVIEEVVEDCRGVEGKSVLIVTHGGPIRTLILQSQNRSFDEFHRLDVPNLATFMLDEMDHGFAINRVFE
uniref:Probable phosphoglycerate mutase n=1 Tax=Candidatus Kentrum sp. TC TaxID=2126339 RepID=A0A450Z563_9GAMM|nr:MAG: probable phosphoglycerate mutase [Candidatus Kentron sp. TC]